MLSFIFILFAVPVHSSAEIAYRFLTNEIKSKYETVSTENCWDACRGKYFDNW